MLFPKSLIFLFIGFNSIHIFAKCEIGHSISGFIKPMKETQMYTKPDALSKKTINLKADFPRSVDSNYELKAICETKNWIKGTIIKVDGNFVEWETGWLQKNDITLHLDSQMETNLPSKTYEDCLYKGILYFKRIEEYPLLPNGRKVEDVAKDRCLKTITAFD